VSQGQYERVKSYVQAGVDEGARLVTGGNRPPHLPTGFFIQPTVSVHSPVSHVQLGGEQHAAGKEY
jgi:betaine-aldehyde dehydrogenase